MKFLLILFRWCGCFDIYSQDYNKIENKAIIDDEILRFKMFTNTSCASDEE